jgi:hypothetical protein
MSLSLSTAYEEDDPLQNVVITDVRGGGVLNQSKTMKQQSTGDKQRVID